MKRPMTILFAATTILSSSALWAAPRAAPVEKLMAHYDRGHSGWDSNERTLTPASVAGGSFGPVWSSPQLDSVDGVPPRLFSTPLLMNAVKMSGGAYRGKAFQAAFVTTTTGFAYAISTAASGKVAPGTILWKTRLTDAPCNKATMGNYGTGIIDERAGRFYVTSCSEVNGQNMWSAEALDVHDGHVLPGWPLNISQTMIDNPSLNRNGTRKWSMGPGFRYVQRAALNLSADGKRLYTAMGADAVGWMLVIDTDAKKLVSAFSSTPNDEQQGGGQWASGGPVVDAQGRLYMSTGANLQNGIKLGLEGIYADSEHSWAQSILQWRDDRAQGLVLTGTYTPYNYCQAARADIDIGSSAPILLDEPAGSTSTPDLLVLGGGKQGNIYLLDRDHMPGNVTKRHPCTIDPADDGSLLAPEVQPEWKRRGPINLFKPFSDEIGAFDQAKSRTTASYYRDAAGTAWIYVTGASKRGENFNTSTPPGLARVKLFVEPGKPAFLRVDKLEMKTSFQNPWSPIISSNGGNDAIVWVFDQNVPRTASIYGDTPPKPFLYAYDAQSLDLLYQSTPGEVFPGGNYSEPTVANGLVLLATDRLQAFGLQTK
jgi:hypothetical protein